MAPTKVKGKIGAVHMIINSLGVMIGLATKSLVSSPGEETHSQIWRVLFAVPIILHILRIIVFSTCFRYETPLYLVLRDKTSEAEDILKMIFTKNIDDRMKDVKKDKEATTENGKSKISDLFSKKYRRAFFTVLVVASGLQLVGFSPIFIFTDTFICESAGYNTKIISMFSTLLGAVILVSTIMTTFIVDKFGRRPLLIFGMLFMALLEITYCVIGYTIGLGNPMIKYLIIIWPVFYRISTGTLGFIYISEVLPAVGVAVSTFLSWILGFLCVQTFMPLVDAISVKGVMAIYAAFCVFFHAVLLYICD